jgi:hypothetical protein
MFGAILSAITGIPALIDAGAALYNSIAGKPTTAKTAEALVADVQTLPADQQKAWADGMNAKLEQYKAESARIHNEQGDVTADILRVLDPKAAAEVAIQRMTTRPKIVMRMGHVILLPIYVICLDATLMFLNGLYRMWSSQRNWAPFDLFAEKLFGEGSLYAAMYNLAAPTAAFVVITYIGAKTVETVKNGASAGDGIGGTLGKAVAAIGDIVGAVKGARGK